MTYMMCRCRVAVYDVWKAIFDSHAQAHREATLELKNLWRCVDEPEHVFFLFAVGDRDLADAFVNSPESAQAGKDGGVIDGEYYFIESAQGY